MIESFRVKRNAKSDQRHWANKGIDTYFSDRCKRWFIIE
jgi:hypothetical protein